MSHSFWAFVEMYNPKDPTSTPWCYSRVYLENKTTFFEAVTKSSRYSKVSRRSLSLVVRAALETAESTPRGFKVFSVESMKELLKINEWGLAPPRNHDVRVIYAMMLAVESTFHLHDWKARFVTWYE